MMDIIVEFKVNRGNYLENSGSDPAGLPRGYQFELRIGRRVLTTPWYIGCAVEIDRVEKEAFEALQKAEFKLPE
jgi:hypothetical protein